MLALLIPLAMGGLLVVLIAELRLAGGWDRWYFTTGMPVYFKEVRLSGRITELPDPEYLDEHANMGDLAQVIAFNRFDDGAVAFREKITSLFVIRYTPIMHGIIELDRAGLTARVTGRLNWFVMGFCVVSLLMSFMGNGIFFALSLGILLFIIYALQVRRYGMIVSALEEYYGITRTG